MPLKSRPAASDGLEGLVLAPGQRIALVTVVGSVRGLRVNVVWFRRLSRAVAAYDRVACWDGVPRPKEGRIFRKQLRLTEPDATTRALLDSHKPKGQLAGLPLLAGVEPLGNY